MKNNTFNLTFTFLALSACVERSRSVVEVCFLLTAFSINLSAQSAWWINNSSKTHIKNGTFIIVPGDVINQNSGTFDNSGTIHLYGNWTNNAGNAAFVNSSPGMVSLRGDTQTIGGSDPTLFYNLDLQGTGVKKLSVNSMAEGVLSLNDRELNTQNYSMSVLNADTSAVTRTTGFVSSLDTGFLARNTNAVLPYFYHVGSSTGTLRYRPVAIMPTSASSNTFSVRMANTDPTLEGFNRDSTDVTVANINDKFYHRINRINGTDKADIKIFYDNVADGNFLKIIPLAKYT
ncbi:MAG: hypothetical protein HY958_08510 [Bacteroidia bacterium]|nr:hypothetical protein [Bacteroidia bacterium]